MARRAKQPKLDSPTARKRLVARHAVYWVTLSAGCSLGYRRASNSKAGTWHVKYAPPKDAGGNGSSSARRVQESLAAADDVLTADGVNVMSFDQARKRATDWFPAAMHKSTGVVCQRRHYTVEDACRDYVHALEGRSRSVYEITTMINRNVVPVLGAVPVEKLTRPRIDDWLRELAETPRRKPRNGLDPQCEEARRRRKDTANRNLTVLKAALNRCVADGRVCCNGLAWKQVKPFKNVGQSRTRFLSDDEARKLVNACTPDFRLIVQAALFSGCRYSEITRLVVSDFDEPSGTLLITESKSGKPRRVYLDSEGVAFFAAVCSDRTTHAVMFMRGNARWVKDSAKGLMVEATRAAQIHPLTFHELRHTAASRWARQGLSLAEIAEQLGHADIRMTHRHYAHLCQRTLANKIRQMPVLGIYDQQNVSTASIQ